jgi:hypothetical protein
MQGKKMKLHSNTSLTYSTAAFQCIVRRLAGVDDEFDDASLVQRQKGNTTLSLKLVQQHFTLLANLILGPLKQYN